MPKDKGVGALAAYAAGEDAHIVFVPESLDAIEELRELLALSGKDHEPATTKVTLQVVGDPATTQALDGARA